MKGASILGAGQHRAVSERHHCIMVARLHSGRVCDCSPSDVVTTAVQMAPTLEPPRGASEKQPQPGITSLVGHGALEVVDVARNARGDRPFMSFGNAGHSRRVVEQFRSRAPW